MGGMHTDGLVLCITFSALGSLCMGIGFVIAVKAKQTADAVARYRLKKFVNGFWSAGAALWVFGLIILVPCSGRNWSTIVAFVVTMIPVGEVVVFRFKWADGSAYLDDRDY